MQHWLGDREVAARAKPKHLGLWPAAVAEGRFLSVDLQYPETPAGFQDHDKVRDGLRAPSSCWGWLKAGGTCLLHPLCLLPPVEPLQFNTRYFCGFPPHFSS